MKKLTACFLLALVFGGVQAQLFTISGTVKNTTDNTPIDGANVFLEKLTNKTSTDSLGNFAFKNLANGTYRLVFRHAFFERNAIEVKIDGKDVLIGDIQLKPSVKELGTVTIQAAENTFGVTRLKTVEGTAIYDGKKNEVIVMKDMDVSLATNSSRQIFSKVPGVNVYESDAAGLQLGVATRGLDPNRTSNFNTRQNGYDMSADALGYPESYYVPPAEAVERIEVVRGAASLQYGPQFGGMLNYVLQHAPSDKKIEWTSYTTAGAYKLVSTFNSIGGTVGCFHYYGYYNYKQGESWRPNAGYKLHTAFASVGYQCSEKLSFNAEYTFSKYLAQQNGGLTDAQFNNNPQSSLRTRNWFTTTWNILALSLNYKYNAFHQLSVKAWGFSGKRDALGFLAPANRTDDLTQNRDFITDKYLNGGLEARYLWKYYLGKAVSSLLVGGRFYAGQTKKAQGFGDNGDQPNFEFVSDSLKNSDYRFPGMNVALFAENVFNLFNKVKITPGIRFEHINTKADGFYKNQTGNDFDSVQHPETRSFKRSFVLLGLGLSYEPYKATELYANFSQNYRGITFTDMRVVRTSQIVDPNLKDESGFNADLGYRGTIKNFFSFDVSGFWLQYNNRIGQLQQVDSAYNIYRYTTNVGKTRALGLEAYAELNILKAAHLKKHTGDLVVFLSTGYTNSVYIKSAYTNVKGKFVEFSPQLTLRSGITYRYRQFSTTINAAFTSQQYTDASNAAFTPTGVNGLIQNYYVLDWSAKYAIKFVQFQAGINNFTNNKYFTRRAVSYPGPGIIPSEPLTFYFTLGIKLNEQAKKQHWNTFKN